MGQDAERVDRAATASIDDIADLVARLETVLAFTDPDHVRAEFRGVIVALANNRLRLVAGTDRQRVLADLPAVGGRGSRLVDATPLLAWARGRSGPATLTLRAASCELAQVARHRWRGARRAALQRCVTAASVVTAHDKNFDISLVTVEDQTWPRDLFLNRNEVVHEGMFWCVGVERTVEVVGARAEPLVAVKFNSDGLEIDGVPTGGHTNLAPNSSLNFEIARQAFLAALRALSAAKVSIDLYDRQCYLYSGYGDRLFECGFKTTAAI